MAPLTASPLFVAANLSSEGNTTRVSQDLLSYTEAKECPTAARRASAPGAPEIMGPANLGIGRVSVLSRQADQRDGVARHDRLQVVLIRREIASGIKYK